MCSLFSNNSVDLIEGFIFKSSKATLPSSTLSDSQFEFLIRQIGSDIAQYSRLIEKHTSENTYHSWTGNYFVMTQI